MSFFSSSAKLRGRRISLYTYKEQGTNCNCGRPGMAGAAIVANPDKAAKISGAVAALEKQGWTWFELTQEG